MSPLEVWKRRIADEFDSTDVLVTGAKPWEGSPPEDHSHYAPHCNWVGTDIASGPGVEIVGDLQRLHSLTERRFGGIFSPATLEHIERPWTAMYSIGQLLLPGGLLYLQTHQTFPLHGYPNDYFRFSKEALETMVWDAGLQTLESGYEFPCKITPPPEVTRWNHGAASFLNVCICAQKPRV